MANKYLLTYLPMHKSIKSNQVNMKCGIAVASNDNINRGIKLADHFQAGVKDFRLARQWKAKAPAKA